MEEVKHYIRNIAKYDGVERISEEDFNKIVSGEPYKNIYIKSFSLNVQRWKTTNTDIVIERVVHYN